MMKRINYIFLITLVLGMMVSCAEKKKSNIIIAPKPVAKVTNKPTQKMSEYEQARDVEWLGSIYKVIVKRTSDSELPIVKIDDTNKYYDNKISLRVLRKDGSEFFKRIFTKSDFTSYLDTHTKEQGALLGIVYVKAESDNLLFAASVGSPDVASDEYVPMVLKISRFGAVSITKDQLLDTDSGEETPEHKGTKKYSSNEEDDDEEEGV